MSCLTVNLVEFHDVLPVVGSSTVTFSSYKPTATGAVKLHVYPPEELVSVVHIPVPFKKTSTSSGSAEVSMLVPSALVATPDSITQSLQLGSDVFNIIVTVTLKFSCRHTLVL